MTEKELLKKSGFYTSFILFFVSLFWLLFSIQISYGGYTGGAQAGIDVGINARATSRMNFQIGTGSTFIMRYGTTTVTGSGSTGYMSGTDSAYPRWVWTPATGRMNFLDITLQQNGVDLSSAGSVTTYWSDILGNPASGTSANSYISSTPAANKIPYSIDGNLGNWVTSLPSVTGNSNFPSGIWNSSGYVGIGAVSPAVKLHIDKTTAGNHELLRIQNSWQATGSTSDIVFGRSAAVNEGITWRYMQGGTSYASWFINGNTEALTINQNGNVGIGTSTPSAQLHTTGSVRFATLGSGAVQSDASGNLSVSSDERLKDIQGNFTAGLSELLGIEPILYKFNKLSGLETENTYAGFSAQNVMQYIPDAVGQDGKGYYTLNDRPIVAALVNSVKKLQEEIEELQKTNNVEVKIYKASPRVKPKLVYTKDICLNDVECPDAVDTHEYIEENTEDDWLGISKEDAFETIAICENIQTGTETTYSYKLEGTESVRVCAEKPVYAKVETEKTEIKLKQDIKFDSENGVFYQKVSVPKLVYKLKSDYSYKDDKYYRKETIEEAKIRMGRE